MLMSFPKDRGKHRQDTDGPRTVKFDDYFHGPREDVLTENVLKPNEDRPEDIVPVLASAAKMASRWLRNSGVSMVAFWPIALDI